MVSRLYKKIRRDVSYFLINHVFSGTRPCYWGIKRFLARKAGIKVGDGAQIVGPLYNTGKLTIGRNTYVNCGLKVYGNGTVFIGDNCDLGPDVIFLTGGHKIGDTSRRAGKGEDYTIKIGNGCWLGSGSIFMNNIEVNESSVVAARACVVRSIESNVLVGGVPAKVIRPLE